MNTPLSLSSRATVLSAATALFATVAKAAPPFDPHATTTTTMIQDDEEKEKEVVDELAEEWSSEKNGEEEEPFSDDDEGGLAKIDQSPDNKDEKADSIFMDSKQDDEEIAVDASEEFDEKLDEPIEDGTEPTAEAGDESFDEERVAEQEEEEEPLDILEEEGGEEPEQQQQEDEANETVKDNLDVNDDDSFGLGDDKETEITTDIFGDDKAEEEETALDAPEEATDEAIEDTTELKDEKLSDDLEEEEDQEDPEQQTNEEELPEIAEENIDDPEPSDEQLLDDGIEESEEPSIDSEQDSVKDFVDEVIEGSENDETKEQDGTFTGDGESAETDMPVEEAWDEDQNAEQESNEEEVQETSEDFPTQVIDMEDKTTEPDSLLDDQIDDDKKDTEVTVPGIVDEEKSSDFLPTSNDTKQDDDFLGAIQEIQDEETEQVVNDINESLEKALDAFQDNQEAPPFGAPSQEPPSTPSHDTTGFLLDENDTKQNDTSGSTLNVLLFIAVLALILLKLPKIKRLLSSRSSADQSLPYHSLRNKIRD